MLLELDSNVVPSSIRQQNVGDLGSPARASEMHAQIYCSGALNTHGLAQPRPDAGRARWLGISALRRQSGNNMPSGIIRLALRRRPRSWLGSVAHPSWQLRAAAL
jgi:hypothetical protein